MSGATYICGNLDDRCEKHDRVLHGYPCGACQDEWRDANPHTAAAISAYALGRGSAAQISAARKADAAACRPVQPDTERSETP